MPIISRQLVQIRPTTGGVFAEFLAVDGKGQLWSRSRARFTSEAFAQADLDAYNWTLQLRDRDFNDLLVWVQERNTVATFDLTDRDITEDEGEEFIMVWFAGHGGNKAITVAWWLDSLNTGQFNTIRDRVPFTGVQGSTITSKFTFLLAAEPWWNVIVEPD